MNTVLKFQVLALLSDIAFAGLMNIFSATSDYNAAQLMDSLFGAVVNSTEFILEGNSKHPLSQDITFWCGNRNNPNLVQTMMHDSSLSSKIASSKPLVFITHGWLDNRDRNWIRAMTTDYLKFVDTNVCVVDWGNLAMYGYKIAAINTYTVGMYLALFITFLTGKGFSLNDITLVGHSMGAQISGHTGYNLGGKIGAIYGLDPASPMFKMPFDVGTSKRLDKSDAKYVQMIITSRCNWGVCVGDGHENFYPNGGFAPQPNCAIPLFSKAESADVIVCSHAHSITLFREALNPSNVFKGNTCQSCLFGLFNKSSRMGIYSSRVGGDFVLLTSPFSPFAL